MRQIMAGGAAGETLDLLGGLARRPSSDSYSCSDQAPMEGQQKLTIFYSGIVNVYENVPAHMAHAIMQLLGACGDQKCRRPPVPEPINSNGVVSSRTLRPTSSITPSSPAEAAAAAQKQQQRQRLVICKRSQEELPFARKASLARFLERRNERMGAKLVSSSTSHDASGVLCKKSKPNYSMEPPCPPINQRRQHTVPSHDPSVPHHGFVSSRLTHVESMSYLSIP